MKSQEYSFLLDLFSPIQTISAFLEYLIICLWLRITSNILHLNDSDTFKVFLPRHFWLIGKITCTAKTTLFYPTPSINTIYEHNWSKLLIVFVWHLEKYHLFELVKTRRIFWFLLFLHLNNLSFFLSRGLWMIRKCHDVIEASYAPSLEWIQFTNTVRVNHESSVCFRKSEYFMLHVMRIY